MSMHRGFLPSRAYAFARFCVAAWAVIATFSHCLYWGTAFLGVEQPELFNVEYGPGRLSAPFEAVSFICATVVLTLLLFALWHAFHALRFLEQPAQAYSELIGHLARFASALLFYSISAAFLAVLWASLEHFQSTGDIRIVLTITVDRITLLIISFVLYCVCNALRVADEAIEETQSFL